MSSFMRRSLVAGLAAAFNAVLIAAIGAWHFSIFTAVPLSTRLFVAVAALFAFVVTGSGIFWLSGRPAVTECRDLATVGDKIVSGINTALPSALIITVNLVSEFSWFTVAIIVAFTAVMFWVGFRRFDSEPWTSRWFRR